MSEEQTPEFRTLRIFMRSGNVVTGNVVTEWEATYRGNKIQSLALTQGPGPGIRIRVELLNFSQIEAITEEMHA